MPGLLFPRNHQLFPVNKVSVQIRIVEILASDMIGVTEGYNLADFLDL